MNIVNVFVVEDESIVSRDIQFSLKKLKYNVVGSASSGDKAIELIKIKNPDIILMDVILKGNINGIQVAEIVNKELDIPVIFLTAYTDEYSLTRAKITEPFGYIIKPFKEIDLYTSIELALYKHKKSRELIKERDYLFSLVDNKDKLDGFIFVKSNSKLIKLKTDEIYFIEALKDYVVINTIDTRYTIHSTMKDIDYKLGNIEFIRVHRSFIVNIDKIIAIDYPNLILEKEKKVIPIGGSYRDDLNNRIRLV
jgi:DNA-binding LytR/AlgR family response regulator